MTAKSIFDLAIEETEHGPENMTERQAMEVDALVKFGKRVVEWVREKKVVSLQHANEVKLIAVCHECHHLLRTTIGEGRQGNEITLFAMTYPCEFCRVQQTLAPDAVPAGDTAQ